MEAIRCGLFCFSAILIQNESFKKCSYLYTRSYSSRKMVNEQQQESLLDELTGTEQIYKIDWLAVCDNRNIGESQRALLVLHADSFTRCGP